MGLYEHRAKVLRAVDGDTIWLAWKDYGDGLKVYGGDKSATALVYRLAGMNAFETSLRYGTTPEQKELGLAAKSWLASQVEGQVVRLKSVKGGTKGGYGRYLAFLFVDGSSDLALDPLDNKTCYNRMLLDRGWAKVSKYGDGEIYEGLGYPRDAR